MNKIGRKYKFNISKVELRNLYIEKKLSEYEIAKIFHCHQMTISRRLHEYNINTRTICKATLNRAKRSYDKSLKNFNGRLKEKAYLIGFRLGDLHVSRAGKNTNDPIIRVRVNSTKLEQIHLFRRLFSKYGYIWQGKVDRSGAISIRCYLNSSFSFLVPKEDCIKNWILKNSRYFISFLAGYIDAEGTFCLCGGDGVFSIRSQDKEIIWQIYFGLNKLGILCKKPKVARLAGDIDYRGIKNNKDAWCLTVYRKNSLLKLIDLIKSILKHPKRCKDMEIVRDNIMTRNKRYNNRFDRRWYKTYFVNENNYVRS